MKLLESWLKEGDDQAFWTNLAKMILRPTWQDFNKNKPPQETKVLCYWQHQSGKHVIALIEGKMINRIGSENCYWIALPQEKKDE